MSNFIDKNPISSQEESDAVFANLSLITAQTLNISIPEAMRRVEKLLKSGILNEPGASPYNPETKRKIDNFLKQVN